MYLRNPLLKTLDTHTHRFRRCLRCVICFESDTKYCPLLLFVRRSVSILLGLYCRSMMIKFNNLNLNYSVDHSTLVSNKSNECDVCPASYMSNRPKYSHTIPELQPRACEDEKQRWREGQQSLEVQLDNLIMQIEWCTCAVGGARLETFISVWILPSSYRLLNGLPQDILMQTCSSNIEKWWNFCPPHWGRRTRTKWGVRERIVGVGPLTSTATRTLIISCTKLKDFKRFNNIWHYLL